MPVLLQAEEIGGLAELPGPIFAQEQCHGLRQRRQQQPAWMDDGEWDMGGRRPFFTHRGVSLAFFHLKTESYHPRAQLSVINLRGLSSGGRDNERRWLQVEPSGWILGKMPSLGGWCSPGLGHRGVGFSRLGQTKPHLAASSPAPSSGMDQRPPKRWTLFPCCISMYLFAIVCVTELRRSLLC